jgi:hypothetical protein
LTDFAFRWNYSPLKREGCPVAGWPFRFARNDSPKLSQMHCGVRAVADTFD